MKSLIKLLVPITLVMFSTSFLISCDNDDLEEKVYYEVSVISTSGGNVAIENYAETSISVLPNTNITVIATAEENYHFAGWFINNPETLISTDANYTFTVNGKISLVAKFYKEPVAVDLGLSVKWASFNVGASSPDEYGGYYAWGETEEKEVYGWDNYKWCNGDYNTMMKYCSNESYGTVDSKIVLDLEDDVAHVKWGGNWRMPTTEEQLELIKECNWRWMFLETTYGCEVTGPNGNCIFLPAAGYRSGAFTLLRGDLSYYWSSSLYNGDYSNGAYNVFFGFDKKYGRSANNRYSGYSVRPVCE